MYKEKVNLLRDFRAIIHNGDCALRDPLLLLNEMIQNVVTQINKEWIKKHQRKVSITAMIELERMAPSEADKVITKTSYFRSSTVPVLRSTDTQKAVESVKTEELENLVAFTK